MIEKNFSLAILGSRLGYSEGQTPFLYLSIPWDLCHKSSVSKLGLPQSGNCCQSANTNVTRTLTAGYITNKRAQEVETFFMDQDLQITRQKILTINKAIRDQHWWSTIRKKACIALPNATPLLHLRISNSERPIPCVEGDYGCHASSYCSRLSSCYSRCHKITIRRFSS